MDLTTPQVLTIIATIGVANDSWENALAKGRATVRSSKSALSMVLEKQ